MTTAGDKIAGAKMMQVLSLSSSNCQRPVTNARSSAAADTHLPEQGVVLGLGPPSPAAVGTPSMPDTSPRSAATPAPDRSLPGSPGIEFVLIAAAATLPTA